MITKRLFQRLSWLRNRNAGSKGRAYDALPKRAIFEPLEDRCLLAVSAVFPTPVGGVLDFSGSLGDDTLQITTTEWGGESALKLSYTEGGVLTERTYTTSYVDTIIFDGGLGNDKFAFDATTGHAGDETLKLHPTSGVIEGIDFRIQFDSVEQNEIYAGDSLTPDGDRAYLYGSTGDDVFSSDGASYSYLKSQDFSMPFFSNAVYNFHKVWVDVSSGGYDEALFNATDQDEIYEGGFGYADIYAESESYLSYGVYTKGFDEAKVSGGTNEDEAYMYDSSGDDAFVATPTSAKLSSDDFSHELSSFGTVWVRACNGGNDIAQLYDSSGDDTFYSRADFASLKGDGFLLRASCFETVEAYGENGGSDSASMYDSANDDTFVATPTSAKLSNEDFSYEAKFFESVWVRAENGGSDLARLYDSIADDAFYSRLDLASLKGAGFLLRASCFETVEAYAENGGTDVASMYDSAGDDTFTSKASYSQMSNNGGSGAEILSKAMAFETVHGFSTEGDDTANFYDSSGDDSFTATQTSAAMAGGGITRLADNFATVIGYSGRGGTDSATLSGSAGSDTFTGRMSYGLLESASVMLRAEGFDSVKVTSEGGDDLANLYDSKSDDAFAGSKESSTLSGTGFSNSVDGFATVYAHSVYGGNDSATLTGTEADETLVATPNYAKLYDSSYYIRANGFTSTQTTGGGGFDLAVMYGSDGDDIFTFDANEKLATLSGDTFSNEATSFMRVKADVRTGNDMAKYYDSAFDDTFTAGSFTNMVTPNGNARVYGLDNILDIVEAHAINGGTNQCIEGIYDYTLNKFGDWI